MKRPELAVVFNAFGPALMTILLGCCEEAPALYPIATAYSPCLDPPADVPIAIEFVLCVSYPAPLPIAIPLIP